MPFKRKISYYKILEQISHMTKRYKQRKKNFFSYYIKMESRSTNNVINAIKEVRELFNEVRSNLSR